MTDTASVPPATATSLTVSDVVSAKPPARARNLFKDKPSSFSNSRQPLLLAVLYAGRDSIGNAPLVDQVLEEIAGQAALGTLSEMNDHPFDRFLRMVTRFDLIEGATNRVVVSPSGMLHKRESNYPSTACGKPVGKNWLQQFARGADLKRRYRYGHETCSGCFADYDENSVSAYNGEIAQAYSDYAEQIEQAKELARNELIAFLHSAEAAKLLQGKLPLTDAILTGAEKLRKRASTISYWQMRQEVAKLFPSGKDGSHHNLPAEQAADRFLSAYATRVEGQLCQHYSADLARQLLARGPEHFAHVIFDCRRNLELAEEAIAAYGFLATLPLPSEEELAAMIALRSLDASSIVEQAMLPKLLVTTWLDGLLPRLRERYPEDKRLDPSLKKAYRLMPNRKPRHTNGTRYLDSGEFVTALRKHLTAEQMSSEHLAAEVNLAEDEINQILAGGQPSLTAYLTLNDWLPERGLAGVCSVDPEEEDE